ncbi:aldo/keto reductase [Nonomuraea sp. NPDC050556]|uniref:aldo/keto reductase n=1 Tax=Nonomuraea sp. NPDC050556 TaxID=3364369 RepID=UPI0037BAD1E1
MLHADRRLEQRRPDADPGFGVFQIPADDTEQAEGYRKFDTAASYENEEAVGRAIGISNFHPDRVVDLVDHNDITPAVNQIEVHPFFQRAADQQINGERGIVIESWGPFAAGKNNLFTDPVLTGIGQAHGKSVAQVVLRWLIQRGIPVNAKSASPERMKANLEVFDFELTGEEMERIAALDTGASLYFDHRDPAMVTWLGNRRDGPFPPGPSTAARSCGARCCWEAP